MYKYSEIHVSISMNQRLQDLCVDSSDKIIFLEHFSTTFFNQKLRSGSIFSMKLGP